MWRRSVKLRTGFWLGLVVLGMVVGVVVVDIMACACESSIPQESELVRYPELAPFLASRAGFKGIRHDLDVGRYEFSFPTALKTSNQYFNAVHASASAAGWSLVTSDSLKRIYSQPSKSYPAAAHRDQVTLIFNPENSSVHFKLEPISSNVKG